METGTNSNGRHQLSITLAATQSLPLGQRLPQDHSDRIAVYVNLREFPADAMTVTRSDIDIYRYLDYFKLSMSGARSLASSQLELLQYDYLFEAELLNLNRDALMGYLIESIGIGNQIMNNG